MHEIYDCSSINININIRTNNLELCLNFTIQFGSFNSKFGHTFEGAKMFKQNNLFECQHWHVLLNLSQQ